jgi:hypothetical protein
MCVHTNLSANDQPLRETYEPGSRGPVVRPLVATHIVHGPTGPAMNAVPAVLVEEHQVHLLVCPSLLVDAEQLLHRRVLSALHEGIEHLDANRPRWLFRPLRTSRRGGTRG